MAPIQNKLLASLSSKDSDALEPHLQSVKLDLRKYLEKPNKRIDVVYFPESGFASVVAKQRDGKEVEVGLIGREGMTGMPIVLGNHRTPHATYVQARGEGHCIRSRDLRQVMTTNQSIRERFLKYVQAFGVQTTHTAICNARSHIEQRLARWLLMAHDRLETNTLPLTDEFLSLMLAVRRAGVTQAVHALEVKGLITRTRGRIEMRNRSGVERLAGEAYGIPEAEYRRLMG
jgi:CRP-like cAMP-binding protein